MRHHWLVHSTAFGSGHPRLGELGGFRRAPGREQLHKFAGEHRRKGLRADFRRRLQPGGLAARDLRSLCQIDSKSGDDPVTRPFEQDTRQLGIAEHQVIGPFERGRHIGCNDVNCLDQRQPRCQRQRGCRRIARPELDQRRTGEIAVKGMPRPALPALAALLLQRDEPIAFDRQLIGQQRAVGRAEPVDDANTAQNRLPAARLVTSPSGPISR